MKKGTVAKATGHTKHGTMYTSLNGHGLYKNQMLFMFKWDMFLHF